MLYKFKQGNLWGMIDEKGLIVGKFSADKWVYLMRVWQI